MTENETVGWHHRLNGHEFKQTPGDGEGQGGLACCSSWDHKELDTTAELIINNKSYSPVVFKHRCSLEKTLMLEKIEGKRWQRLRCLASIANSRDVNLNKLWEIVVPAEHEACSTIFGI